MFSDMVTKMQGSIVHIIQYKLFSALRADEIGVFVCIDTINSHTIHRTIYKVGAH